MNEITPSDVIQWQNEILQKGFSASYLRMIQNQLTSLFTHATKIYNVRRHIVVGAKRILFSVKLPTRLCRTGTYRRFLTA